MEIEVLFEDQPIFIFFKRESYAKSPIKEHFARKKLNFFYA